MIALVSLPNNGFEPSSIAGHWCAWLIARDASSESFIRSRLCLFLFQVCFEMYRDMDLFSSVNIYSSYLLVGLQFN